MVTFRVPQNRVTDKQNTSFTADPYSYQHLPKLHVAPRGSPPDFCSGFLAQNKASLSIYVDVRLNIQISM